MQSMVRVGVVAVSILCLGGCSDEGSRIENENPQAFEASQRLFEASHVEYGDMMPTLFSALERDAVRQALAAPREAVDTVDLAAFPFGNERVVRLVDVFLGDYRTDADAYQLKRLMLGSSATLNEVAAYKRERPAKVEEARKRAMLADTYYRAAVSGKDITALIAAAKVAVTSDFADRRRRVEAEIAASDRQMAEKRVKAEEVEAFLSQVSVGFDVPQTTGFGDRMVVVTNKSDKTVRRVTVKVTADIDGTIYEGNRVLSYSVSLRPGAEERFWARELNSVNIKYSYGGERLPSSSRSFGLMVLGLETTDGVYERPDNREIDALNVRKEELSEQLFQLRGQEVRALQVFSRT